MFMLSFGKKDPGKSDVADRFTLVPNRSGILSQARLTSTFRGLLTFIIFASYQTVCPATSIFRTRMRSIARQSARLASQSRVRQPSRSSRLPAQHSRSLSTSASSRVENRGPGDPHDHSSSLDPRREEQERPEENAKTVKKEGEGEGEDGETKQADNRLWPLSNRTHRDRRSRNKSPDIPKPPPIPQWFLDHNVKLRVEPAKPDSRIKHSQDLQCLDAETGHVLFTVPYYGVAEGAVASLRAFNLEQAEDLTNKQHEKSTSSAPKPLERSFFDNKFEAPSAKAPPPDPKSDSPAGKILDQGPTVDLLEPHELLRWHMLEAETSVRAAFAMAAFSSQPHSHAASRVDLSLVCPDSHSHDQMDDMIEDLASLTQANVVRFDANDFSELSADYVGRSSDSPGSFSHLAYDVFDGYASEPSKPARVIEEPDDEMDEDEGEEEEEDRGQSGDGNSGRSSMLDSLRQALSSQRLARAFGKDGIAAVPIGMTMTARFPAPGGSQSGEYRSERRQEALEWEDARLKALLDNLLDAPKTKATSATPQKEGTFNRRVALNSDDSKHQLGSANSDASYATDRVSRNNPYVWCPEIALDLSRHIATHITKRNPKEFSINLTDRGEELPQAEINANGPTARTIVHVRDLKDLCSSKTGDAVLRNLVKVVQKRRSAGEQIVIVGTTAQDGATGPFMSFTQTADEQEFRKIKVAPWFNMRQGELSQSLGGNDPRELKLSLGPPYRRILEINVRHIQAMLRRTRPEDSIDLFSESSKALLDLAGSRILSTKVLPFDQVQRVVLTALGFSRTHAISEAVTAGHIGLAAFMTTITDRLNREWTDMKFKSMTSTTPDAEVKDGSEGSSSHADKSQARIEKLKKSCNNHEQKLLPGVVDAQNIKTGFNDVHAPSETLDALKTLTSLSLLRPDAFKYGVLAADRLPGIMLYGPPGTGKTLLAKAVAKESRATVLEISGAQIYEKYVGEGEKMVRAVFSLAKKLSPCIVFIDEGDAIFGSRSSAGNRNTHREIINQFLREWDGMDSHHILIMMASNRPFDVDDAVLRRLPRRLLVDLPVAKDRESILKIHLKDENLDETVSLADLAEQTPLYSGSDLKNLCVAAALACVREENDLINSKQDEPEFKLPEKRTLSSRHFEKAIKEISASISEDMSSLTAIRKFDEQYGDRRGRRKKTSYGFGMTDGSVDESAARVRQSPPPP